MKRESDGVGIRGPFCESELRVGLYETQWLNLSVSGSVLSEQSVRIQPQSAFSLSSDFALADSFHLYFRHPSRSRYSFVAMSFKKSPKRLKYSTQRFTKVLFSCTLLYYYCLLL